MLVVAHGKGGHQAVLSLNALVERSLRVYGMPAHGYPFTTEDGRPYRAGTVGTYIGRTSARSVSPRAPTSCAVLDGTPVPCPRGLAAYTFVAYRVRRGRS